MLKGFTIKFLIVIVLVAGLSIGIRYIEKVPQLFPDDSAYDDIIFRVSEKYNVDPYFVKSVIWRESNFNSQARGAHGEIGLMQIMPKSATVASVVTDWERAHKRNILTEGSLFSPATNIEIGAWYLSKALNYYRGYKYQKERALCVYNRGKSTTNSWMKGLGKDDPIMDRIGSDMTREYVKKIMVKYHTYKMENE